MGGEAVSRRASHVYALSYDPPSHAYKDRIEPRDEALGKDPPPRRTVKFASCRYLLIVVMIQLRWGVAWRSGSKIVLSELFFISCVNPFYFPSVGPEHGRI